MLCPWQTIYSKSAENTEAGVESYNRIIGASYSMMPQIIQTGVQLVVNLAIGLVQAIPQLITALPQITGSIVNGFMSINWFDLGLQLIKSIREGIKSIRSALWNGVKEKASEVWGGVKNVVSEKLNNIKNAYAEHGGGLKGATFAAIEGVKSYYTAGFTFLDNLTDGKLSAIVNKVSEKLEPVKEVVANIFEKIKPILTNVTTFFKNSFDNVKNVVVNIFNGIKTNIAGFVNNIKQPLTTNLERYKKQFFEVKTIIINVLVYRRHSDVKRQNQNIIYRGIIGGIGSIFEGAKTVIVNWLTIVASFDSF